MNLGIIFCSGVGILIGAIVLNIISAKLGLMNWYQFIDKPGDASLFSMLWLFVLYPLGLGFIAYKIFSTFLK